ncbi:SETMAR [Lepeophtheirus salmonis]|uniref:SETMAR n=1 Tax=Lepeophtheirus salmonis TaxID=72036 RepID=A0A7R8D5U5_LEPSM|nr:SETMAR [Lepeophtheirus salmonis]CAF3008164.1 SETMAR [Lepeophtheirus salmonis]
MLERNVTVTKELYKAQLHSVKEAMQVNKPNRHIAKPVNTTLEELKWEVLHQPPYSPDLTLTDYQKFRSLSNHLRDVTFDNEKDLDQWLNNFFDTRTDDFLGEGHRKIGR